MADQERAIIAMLERIGITIAPRHQGKPGWGWSIQNDKIFVIGKAHTPRRPPPLSRG